MPKRNRPNITFYCTNCFIEIGTFSYSQISQGRGKYCSNKCTNSGKHSHKWKDKPKYSAIHKWLLRNFGNPNKCEHCGLKGKRNNRQWNIEWANISGKYFRNSNDFIGLCRPCHSRYDILKAGNKVKNQHGVHKLRESLTAPIPISSKG